MGVGDFLPTPGLAKINHLTESTFPSPTCSSYIQKTVSEIYIQTDKSQNSTLINPHLLLLLFFLGGGEIPGPPLPLSMKP